MTEITRDRPIVDFEEALDNLEGDVELLHDVAEIFMDRGRTQLETISRAIVDGDFRTTMIEAHGMKGGASNFCAGRFTNAALGLEMLAKSETLVGAEALFEVMRREFDNLAAAIDEVDWSALEIQYAG